MMEWFKMFFGWIFNAIMDEEYSVRQWRWRHE